MKLAITGTTESTCPTGSRTLGVVRGPSHLFLLILHAYKHALDCHFWNYYYLLLLLLLLVSSDIVLLISTEYFLFWHLDPLHLDSHLNEPWSRVPGLG